MGTKQSKTAAELDLDKIEQLADEQDYAKKKKHLEPDLIGAKLGRDSKWKSMGYQTKWNRRQVNFCTSNVRFSLSHNQLQRQAARP